MCLLVAAVIAIVIAVVKYGKEEEFFDEPIGLNFMADHCDGRFIGVEKKSELGKDGRKIITLEPRDVNPYQMEKAKNVPVVVDRNKLISLPKGVVSRDKNINIYLPPSLADFPPALKETLFGKIMMFLTAITDASNAEIAAFQEGMKRQSQHVKTMATGEVSLERMNQIEEIYDDLLTAAKDTKKGDKFPAPGTITPPSGPR